jgi:hypothetical protein
MTAPPALEFPRRGTDQDGGMSRSLAGLLLCAPFALGAAVASTPAGAGGGSARIVNGTFSFADPTAAALLLGSDPDHAVAWCTATLVGCRTLVTAAHCACDLDGAACQSGAGARDPADLHVFFQHGGFFELASITVHPGFAFPRDDVAVLELATPVSGISPTPLATSEPPLGTEGTIVGFGRAGGGAEDYGLKRRGAVTTSQCPVDLAGLVCWEFASPVGPPGTDSNTCNGDSGGPLFVDAAGARELAGLTAGGSTSDCLADDQSYDTNVAAQRPWIEAQAGADLASATCGSLSQVGDAATRVVGFTGDLDAARSQGAHAFDAGPGLAKLRIAMNASEEPGADFDLYVRFGAAPTLAEWDCRAFGPNQFGVCEFDAPAEGAWHVLVNRFAGAATYQVTATLFAGEGEPPPPPPEGEPQTRAQRHCLNRLADAGARVARAQARDTEACLRNFARGRFARLGRGAQPRTAVACLGNDVDGRVGRALERTLRRDAERCLARPEQEPGFAYRGSGPANAGARGEMAALASDLFGADLDGALARARDDRRGARCQETVARASGAVFEAAARVALRGQRGALRGRGGEAGADSALALETDILSSLARDSRGRLRRARAHLATVAARACAAVAETQGQLFPGACAGASGAGELADCADRLALCRFCRAQNAMNGLGLDCDLLDDGVPDLSCS